VGERILGRAVERVIDRLHRLGLAAQPHQRHRAEIGGADVFRIELECAFRGLERGRPAVPRELD
jgi:hypothetical protein